MSFHLMSKTIIGRGWLPVHAQREDWYSFLIISNVISSLWSFTNIHHSIHMLFWQKFNFTFLHEALNCIVSYSLHLHGIWQDAAMQIRIIPWNLHLLHNSDIFRVKQKKYLILVIKQLLTILTNIKAKEIDHFKMLIFLNIEENTLFRLQDESS